MATVTKIGHIAIAVENLEEAREFWETKLGIPMERSETVTSQKAKVAFFPLGGSEIELVEPTSASTGTAKFIAKRGPGMHHLCLEVDDIEEMMASLRTKGVRLIDETPVDLGDRKMAFIHPRSTGGVLIELYQVISPDSFA